LDPNYIDTAIRTYRSIVNGVEQDALAGVCDSLERPELSSVIGMKRERDEGGDGEVDESDT
jgi:hypothetical protein